MGLLHKECYKNAWCAHMGECFEIQTGQMQRRRKRTQGDKESSEAQMSSFCVEARWQIAGVERWKREKTTDLLYSTLLQEMDSTPLFYFLFLSSMPVSEWWIRVRRGWVLGGSEQPAPTHRGWDASGGQRRIRKKERGSDEERMFKKIQELSIKLKTALCLVLMYFKLIFF